MTQVEYISEPSTFYDFLTSDNQQVEHVSFVNEQMVELRWKYKETFVEPSARTNVILAAYTTAHARLKLYSYMEPLQERLLYADTDSIIFVTREHDDYVPPTGDYLGDLTNEVPSGRIIEFVAGGPKNYSYRVIEDNGAEKTECKVRGITLNHKNSALVNFDSLKHIILEAQGDSLSVCDTKIVRHDNRLLTLQQPKTYNFVFDKRVIVEKYRTLPYGY